MEPIVNGLETDFEKDVTFDRVDASSDRGRAAMEAYTLRVHPSYIILDADGDALWQATGQMEESVLRSQLTSLRP